MENGFKIDLINKHIHQFLHRKYNDKVPLTSVPKQEIYFKLPFYGDESFKVRTKLTKLLNESYP